MYNNSDYSSQGHRKRALREAAANVGAGHSPHHSNNVRLGKFGDGAQVHVDVDVGIDLDHVSVAAHCCVEQRCAITIIPFDNITLAALSVDAAPARLCRGATCPDAATMSAA
jgi:hypothetical protein